jgi:hypothetical protein
MTKGALSLLLLYVPLTNDRATYVPGGALSNEKLPAA